MPGTCQKLSSYFSTPAIPRRCFAEDSETLVIVAASTMTDMFGATFRLCYYGERCEHIGHPVLTTSGHSL